MGQVPGQVHESASGIDDGTATGIQLSADGGPIRPVGASADANAIDREGEMVRFVGELEVEHPGRAMSANAAGA